MYSISSCRNPRHELHSNIYNSINTLFRTLQSVHNGQMCAFPHDQLRDQEQLEGILEGIHQTLKSLRSILNASQKENESKLGPVIESTRQHIFELLLFDEDLMEREKDNATRDSSSSSIRKSLDSSDDESKETSSDILIRLSPIDHLAQHNTFLEKHCKGTGEALLQSSQFQAWVDGENQTLFCPGIPGSGKSVFASTVVDHLQQLFKHDDTVGIAYIYCDFQRHRYQSAREILGSLVKQLARRPLDFPEALKVLDRDYKEYGRRISLVDVSRALNEVAGLFSRLFIVIDALDEVNINDGSHKRILSGISQLRIRYRLNFLVTSRPVPAISGLFKDEPSMEIRADKNDVKKYVSSNLECFPPSILRNGELQKQIIDGIADSAEGM